MNESSLPYVQIFVDESSLPCVQIFVGFIFLGVACPRNLVPYENFCAYTVNVHGSRISFPVLKLIYSYLAVVKVTKDPHTCMHDYWEKSHIKTLHANDKSITDRLKD